MELPVFPRRGADRARDAGGRGHLAVADRAAPRRAVPAGVPGLAGGGGGATIEDAGFAPRVTMGGLDEVLRAGLRVAPGLSEATVTETRVGLRPVHAPGPPLIGPVNDRVIVATGLGAYGLTAGPFTGRVAAGLALGEEPPLNLRPYHPPTPLTSDHQPSRVVASVL
ncbi:NAD(P)/FAD-dependent oxidoreductase [Nonomuraea ferruginea]